MHDFVLSPVLGKGKNEMNKVWDKRNECLKFEKEG